VPPGLDVLGVLVFVGIGRSVHDHGVSLAGMASTAWPFLTGLALGWLATRAWRRWTVIIPVGVGVWVATVGAGMVLRQLSGQGTAVAFVVVALAFLGLVLIGWRAAWGLGVRLKSVR
jgi:hypothetical protein